MNAFTDTFFDDAIARARAAADSYAAGDRPRSVVVDDLDGDGVPDLVVACEDGDEVSVPAPFRDCTRGSGNRVRRPR